MMSEGRFADAVPLWSELVRSAPGNAGLLLNLGIALHMSGRDTEALGEFAKVLKVQPSAVPALVL